MALKDTIADIYKGFLKAFETDGTEFAKFFTEDAMFMAPNGPPIVGRDGIAHVPDHFRSMGFATPKLVPQEVHKVSSDVAWERGVHYLHRALDGVLVETGKYIVIWKKVDGRWHVHRDCFNGDHPPPSA
ncbi:hypothetical protein M427DRAFT_54190 [Gonapodya prolifera JEL478]|uniref:DUF4440 domain-containing protein n=1 Tax=Gonapodya prolifera (strain JEL478) TaxID=1344416 RepID=A0A139AMH5_GONPJ|nr:hypothetical protein M427DRAFT_54190 [Gonapodya prolifera JEL478]|eukprot:KXS17970.1 hypothetical protein M427DRAFT_54190 [Gonapodya prolifera JEL478]